jgi:hypothetical protein
MQYAIDCFNLINYSAPSWSRVVAFMTVHVLLSAVWFRFFCVPAISIVCLTIYLIVISEVHDKQIWPHQSQVMFIQTQNNSQYKWKYTWILTSSRVLFEILTVAYPFSSVFLWNPKIDCHFHRSLPLELPVHSLFLSRSILIFTSQIFPSDFHINISFALNIS